jgi:hypothetical protein
MSFCFLDAQLSPTEATLRYGNTDHLSRWLDTFHAHSDLPRRADAEPHILSLLAPATYGVECLVDAITSAATSYGSSSFLANADTAASEPPLSAIERLWSALRAHLLALFADENWLTPYAGLLEFLWPPLDKHLMLSNASTGQGVDSGLFDRTVENSSYMGAILDDLAALFRITLLKIFDGTKAPPVIFFLNVQSMDELSQFFLKRFLRTIVADSVMVVVHCTCTDSTILRMDDLVQAGHAQRVVFADPPAPFGLLASPPMQPQDVSPLLRRDSMILDSLLAQTEGSTSSFYRACNDRQHASVVRHILQLIDPLQLKCLGLVAFGPPTLSGDQLHACWNYYWTSQGDYVPRLPFHVGRETICSLQTHWRTLLKDALARECHAFEHALLEYCRHMLHSSAHVLSSWIRYLASDGDTNTVLVIGYHIFEKFGARNEAISYYLTHLARLGNTPRISFKLATLYALQRNPTMARKYFSIALTQATDGAFGILICCQFAVFLSKHTEVPMAEHVLGIATRMLPTCIEPDVRNYAIARISNARAFLTYCEGDVYGTIALLGDGLTTIQRVSPESPFRFYEFTLVRNLARVYARANVSSELLCRCYRQCLGIAYKYARTESRNAMWLLLGSLFLQSGHARRGEVFFRALINAPASTLRPSIGIICRHIIRLYHTMQRPRDADRWLIAAKGLCVAGITKRTQDQVV